MDEKIRCSRCHRERSISFFMKGEKTMKTCSTCRENKKKCSHNKQKSSCVNCSPCPHGKIKHGCKECSPCPHGKIKTKCFDCGGGSACIHSSQKAYCKKCQEPFNIIIKNWIRVCRHIDKKFKRFDADRFIDTDFLRGLLEDYKKCYYEDCKVEFEYIEKNKNLVTIERINNNKGHVKSNCVLACLSCNSKRKSNATTI